MQNFWGISLQCDLQYQEYSFYNSSSCNRNDGDKKE